MTQQPGTAPTAGAATSSAPEAATTTTSFTRGLLDRVRGRDKGSDPGADPTNATSAGPTPSGTIARTVAPAVPAEPAERRDEPATGETSNDETKVKPLGWRERLGLGGKDEKAAPGEVAPTGPGVPTAAAAAALATVVSPGQQPPTANAAPSGSSTPPGVAARSTSPSTANPAERPTSYRSPVTPVAPVAPTQGPDTAVIPAVGAGAAAVASSAAAATAQPLAAAKPKVGVARRTRKARLRLSRLDPWSVMKTAFLFSIAAGIMFVVASYGVWAVLNASGLFASVNDIVKSVVSTPGDTTPFRVEEYVNTQKVMGVAALIAVVDVLIFTALATLGSFLYNLAATVLGGLEVTLAED